MAGDNRGSSSLFRRAEQLKRWQESETNKQDLNEHKSKKRKVKFSDGCVFLAAAAAGDKEELKRLLDRGADINTVNQDGITALHAACIDNNLEIVEFLVDNNADINRCDMEGWTPLHATASCGSHSMAEFLISRGADLSLVNNDGELPIDVVDNDDMAQLLQDEMETKGIDSDASRTREERSMLEDAKVWLATGKVKDAPHSKTGASALHVAAAKGYMKVLRILLELGVDIDAKDFDGWSSLHAAAHWGQTEAVEVLCEAFADMDSVNNVGQTPYDLADESLKPLMEQLARKQASSKILNQNRATAKKRKSSPVRKERPNSKDEKTARIDSCSEGTSGDESGSERPEEGGGEKNNRWASSADQQEVQSWRRGSLKTKTTPLDNDKIGSKEEAKNTEDPSVNHMTDEVVLRKPSRDERNCHDASRLIETSVPTTSSSSLANSSNRTSSSLLHSSRSFVPPSRDEESETQRKAHAKMVRSTRRSTQGITLEDLKSAEQYMHKSTIASTKTPTTTTLVTTTPASTEDSSAQLSSQTPNSSSLHANNYNNSDSSLNSVAESKPDANKTSKTNHENHAFSLETVPPKSSPTSDESTNASTNYNHEEKKDEKNEDKNSSSHDVTREGTQAVIQRRKKAKRRSTGVVHVDMDEIDPDRKLERNEDDDHGTCASDLENVSSKQSSGASKSDTKKIHNGTVDYKKLYEEQLAENARLLERLRLTENDLQAAKESRDAQTKAASASAESDRRDKRNMERKLSEMEEELKGLDQLRQENQRLKDENGALIRVISKLSR